MYQRNSNAIKRKGNQNQIDLARFSTFRFFFLLNVARISIKIILTVKKTNMLHFLPSWTPTTKTTSENTSLECLLESRLDSFGKSSN